MNTSRVLTLDECHQFAYVLLKIMLQTSVSLVSGGIFLIQRIECGENQIFMSYLKSQGGSINWIKELKVTKTFYCQIDFFFLIFQVLVVREHYKHAYTQRPTHIPGGNGEQRTFHHSAWTGGQVTD